MLLLQNQLEGTRFSEGCFPWDSEEYPDVMYLGLKEEEQPSEESENMLLID